MRYTFNDIGLGDMFNTISGRWVKTSIYDAICVMSAHHELGAIQPFDPDDKIVLLYPPFLKSDEELETESIKD